MQVFVCLMLRRGGGLSVVHLLEGVYGCLVALCHHLSELVAALCLNLGEVVIVPAHCHGCSHSPDTSTCRRVHAAVPFTQVAHGPCKGLGRLHPDCATCLTLLQVYRLRTATDQEIWQAKNSF